MTEYVQPGETISKDPNSELDYGATWAKFLAQCPGDAIATSEWLIPAELDGEGDPVATRLRFSETHPQSTIDGAITVTWLIGGTPGRSYDVVNRIRTIEGRSEDQIVPFYISEH